MNNKDNIIIADCKFNVCEQKTSGKNEIAKTSQNTGKTIQISNVQAQDIGGGAKSYESFHTKAICFKSESGVYCTEQRKNGNITFQTDLFGVKKFFR